MASITATYEMLSDRPKDSFISIREVLDLLKGITPEIRTPEVLTPKVNRPYGGDIVKEVSKPKVSKTKGPEPLTLGTTTYTYRQLPSGWYEPVAHENVVNWPSVKSEASAIKALQKLGAVFGETVGDYMTYTTADGARGKVRLGNITGQKTMIDKVKEEFKQSEKEKEEQAIAA